MQGRVYCTRLSRPLERIKPRPADRRNVIRDKKLVGIETAQAGRAFTRRKIGRLEMIDVAKVRYPPA